MRRTLLCLTLFSASLAAKAQTAAAPALSVEQCLQQRPGTTHRHSDALQIHPNPSEDGNITVSSKKDQSLHFYIFDVEGTMIYQAVLKGREKKAVDRLAKGTYLYTVFCNDESIAEGKLVIR
jgi:hypothetical protein